MNSASEASKHMPLKKNISFCLCLGAAKPVNGSVKVCRKREGCSLFFPEMRRQGKTVEDGTSSLFTRCMLLRSKSVSCCPFFLVTIFQTFISENSIETLSWLFEFVVRPAYGQPRCKIKKYLFTVKVFCYSHIRKRRTSEEYPKHLKDNSRPAGANLTPILMETPALRSVFTDTLRWMQGLFPFRHKRSMPLLHSPRLIARQ